MDTTVLSNTPARLTRQQRRHAERQAAKERNAAQRRSHLPLISPKRNPELSDINALGTV